ncbi:MAG: alpha/beta fold hydrolase, partial [Gemmataceae bacterium]|nr:alpha/beta fold hydrolase [Gemmataceae bacterium]
YAWFVKHLQGREQTVQEPPFRPVPPKELSVFDSTHPRPKDERNAAQLRQYLTEQSDKQLADLIPTNSEQLDKFRQTLGTALRVMIHSELPIRVLERNVPGLELPRTMTRGRWQIELRLAGRTDEADAVPLAVCQDPQRVVPGRYVVWLHPQGKSSLIAVQQLQEALSQVLSAGFSVVAPDLFGTGDNTLTKPYAVNKDFAGYTYGYNRSLLAQQVHDALTTIGWCRQQQPQAVVHLVGWDHGGLIALLTKALAQRAVKRTAADLQQFRFADLTDVADPRMLPGAVKYGDVAGFACLCAPEPLLVHNHQWLANHRWPTQVYQVAGAARQWSCSSELLSPRDVVQWLLDQS